MQLDLEILLPSMQHRVLSTRMWVEMLTSSMQQLIEIQPPSMQQCVGSTSSMQLDTEFPPPSMQQCVESHLPACSSVWTPHFLACNVLSLHTLSPYLRGQSRQLPSGAGPLHLCWAPWWQRGSPRPWLSGSAQLSQQLPGLLLQIGAKEETENIGTGEWTALFHKNHNQKDGGLQSPPESVLFTLLKEGRLG